MPATVKGCGCMKRGNYWYLVAFVLVLCSGVAAAGAGTSRHHHARTRARWGAHIRSRVTTPPTTSKPAATTTTKPAADPVTTTTAAPLPPVDVDPPTMPVPAPEPLPPTAGVGVPMLNGQTDINAAPAGTTFCLSGTHNWDLTPKTGDRFIGPAVLDGGHATKYAFEPGGAKNVLLAQLEIRNYAPGYQMAAVMTNPSSSGWTL